ncbi:MAG: winged helix-turn-helix transcriptional regulator [Acidimicrobiales bacterium]
MRWTDIGTSRCSIARALSVVGDRWTLLLLREAFLGVTRFEELRENTGAARHIVAERVTHLVEHGVLDRVPYQDRPPRHEYRLTAKGRALYPVVMTLLAWGDQWMADGQEPSLTVIHDACGATTVPELHCSVCGAPVVAGETHHVVDGR